jgi:two-component system OmpR family sensor kinase
MARLVEDLLLTSGVDATRDSARAPFHPSAAIAAALAATQITKPVHVDADESVVAIGDEARATVLLTHLLENAEKFSSDDATIRIAVVHDGDGVSVVVADDGPGIPEDLRGRIFERFFQVDGSSTRQKGGAGLGLFIASRLATSMGGQLSLDEATCGASFRFALPALAAIPAAQAN